MLPGQGSRIFEIAFIVTTPLALWVVLAFVAEEFIEVVLPQLLGVPDGAVHLAVLALLYAGTWLAVRGLRRRRTGMLATPEGYSKSQGTPPLVGWSIAAYLIGVLVVGASAYLLVSREEEHWGLLVWGLATWLPLWFAVPIGAIVAWSRSRG